MPPHDSLQHVSYDVLTWTVLVFHSLFYMLFIIIVIISEVFYVLCIAIQLSLCCIENVQCIANSHLMSLFYISVKTVFYELFVCFVFIMKYIFVCIVALQHQECEHQFIVLCMYVLRRVLHIYCFSCCRCCRGFTLISRTCTDRCLLWRSTTYRVETGTC